MKRKNLICVLFVFIVVNLINAQYDDLASWPIGSQDDITSTFGPRYWSGRTNNYDFHRGIDINGNAGDYIYAATDGVVIGISTSSQTNNQLGYILVRYDFFLNGTQFSDYYRYTHITPNTNLSVGDEVIRNSTLIGTVHSYVQFGTHLDLKWYWDNTELTSAQHPLQILENYNNYHLNEVIGISSIKNDVAGNYIEISVSSPADAPDMEWIVLESLSGRTRNGFIYDEYGLLRYTSEFPPQVDFKRRINCGDVLGDDSDDGIVGNLSGEIALKIVTQNFDRLNPQVLKFRFYLEDQFFEDYNYNLVELTGNIRIEDCLGESRECPNFPFLQPGPVTFNPPPGPITVEDGQWQFIDMYSDVNGTIYFTDLFYTNCAEIPDVRWGYSPYYYDENETRWRRIPNSTGIFCLKAAVYTGGENFTDNVCGCWDVTVITGVYDYLNISELSATQTLIENNNYYYEAFFIDADNDGTTFNDWNWKLKLFHSGGEYVFQTGNNFTFGGLYYCLPDGYNWTLVDGKIQGEVVCYGYDSDGAYQEDTFPIEAEVANDCLVTPVISHFTQTPSPICQGSSGYVYVHLQQGSGTLNYSWTTENLPPGAYITP